MQYTVMRMGLKNAPPFFQNLMEDELFTARLELRAFVSTYIDDIIIATEEDGLLEEEPVVLHENPDMTRIMDIQDAN